MTRMNPRTTHMNISRKVKCRDARPSLGQSRATGRDGRSHQRLPLIIYSSIRFYNTEVTGIKTDGHADHEHASGRGKEVARVCLEGTHPAKQAALHRPWCLCTGPTVATASSCPLNHAPICPISSACWCALSVDELMDRTRAESTKRFLLPRQVACGILMHYRFNL